METTIVWLGSIILEVEDVGGVMGGVLLNIVLISRVVVLSTAKFIVLFPI